MKQLNLQTLQISEKIELMEKLWASLQQSSDSAALIPDWHEAVVSRRLEQLQRGEDTILDWEEVKLGLNSNA